MFETAKTSGIDPPSSRSLYLRLSLTSDCNLACKYCRPRNGDPRKKRRVPLGDEELIELVRFIDRVRPIHKLRFTGGEPLLRPRLTDLIEAFKNLLPGVELCLTTNGMLLEGEALKLKQAGLQSLNVSLDTTDEGRFKEVAGREGLSRVLKGIAAAREAGFRKIKLNSVLMRSFNGDRLPDLVKIAARFSSEIRFVELMPFGEGAALFDEEFLSADEALAVLKRRFSYIRQETSSATAERHLLDVDGQEVFVGFITAISRRFCNGCNRIRLDSSGRIYPCLRTECGLHLKEDLQHEDWSGLEDKIRRAVDGKEIPEAFWPRRSMVHLGG